MAFIGTLRTRLTGFVVGFVFIAMAAFIIGGDLLGSGPRSVFGGQDNIVGEIGGHEVTIDEFNAASKQIESMYTMNGMQVTEAQMPAIRNQAWELLIAQYAVRPEFEKVGVEVTSEELLDLIQGKNIDDGIRNSFRDSLGRFDRDALNRTLAQFKEFKKGDPRRAQWDSYESNLRPARERLKYENTLLKTTYVTQAEAEREYHAQTDVAEVKYLYIPLYALSDSGVTVTDSELRAYYEKNKERYKSEQTRSLSYVTFPVIPSAADSASVKKGLGDLVESFKTAESDSLFALSNSNTENVFATYNPSTLPGGLSDQLETLKPGTLVGPYLEGGSYKLMKVVRIASDTNYFVRASNILIGWDDPSDASKKKAKEKARQVLNEIRGGASFVAKAFEYNTDITKTKGGDLGWFGKGKMMKAFEDAAFKATRKGLLNDIIETSYGYHIIEVTGIKNNSTYTGAVIEDEITPSDVTRNEAYRKADAFASGLSSVDAFNEKAKASNLAAYEAKGLTTNDRRINNLGDARELITWLFRDSEIGKVSEVKDVDDSYVVAVMTSEVEKGYKPFDQVKDEVTPLAKNEAKAAQIIAKLTGKTEDLETLGQQFGRDAVVNSSNDLKFSSNSMVSVGVDPGAIGKAFSLENGKRSAPFKGENGVLIIEMKNKTIAPAVADYTNYKTQLIQVQNSISYNIAEALKESANIVDNRYRFF